MFALLSRCRSVFVYGFGLRHFLFAAAILLPNLLVNNTVRAEDLVRVATTGWGRYDEHGNQYFLKCDRAPDRVPTEVPQGLPANYLAADSSHGAVVDFIDEFDSTGVRVTARRYADGYVMIETPHSAKNDR